MIFFVEDQAAYDLRMRDVQRRLERELQERRAKRVHPLVELILEVLQAQDGEMPITSVANETVKQLPFQNRAERDQLYLKIFRRVGELIKIGKLERVRRKCVRIPLTDELERAYWAKNDAIIRNSPPRLR